MKILVVSDTHRNVSLLKDLYYQNAACDYFLHLGDSELPEYLMNDYSTVKGNCDYADFPKVKDIEIDGLKIHMEHGDGFKFQMNPTKYIEDLNCDIFLFGHTHKKLANKVKNTYIFNPGSLTRPRDGSKGSYLILTLENKKLVKYEFKEIDL